MNSLYLNEVALGGDIVKIYEMENTKEQNIPVCNFLLRVKNKRGMESLVEVNAYGDLAGQVMEFCQTTTVIHVQAEVTYKRDKGGKGNLRIIASHIQFISKCRPYKLREKN